ncbi:MAG: ferritin family protein [Desulfuromonadales bacterium]|nr:ferritin family protein [Desulfuromonadales bacterium]
MNVFDFAMQMEVDGKKLYEKLAAGSNDAGLRKIFLLLAADEQKHFEIFQALQQGTQPTMQDTTALEESRLIFREAMANKDEILKTIDVDLEGYRYAMKLEADSARLYEDAAKRESQQEIKELLLRVAGEEQKHFNILENIYDFFNAPNQYLAWREFSNLEEFHQFGRDVDR